jgi:Fe-S-cluster-containing dehydrogenase component
MQCRHCEDAPCAVVCPKDALHRPSAESPVLLDPEFCICCKFCLLACPYGVIHIPSDRKVAVKCDLCIARTEAGELPACVEACPTAALEYADVDDDFRQRAAAFAERVSADAAAHAEAVDAEQKSVNCEVCGCLVGPRKQIELMRKKLSENVPVANICYRCRRSRAAQLLAEMCEQPVPATEL